MREIKPQLKQAAAKIYSLFRISFIRQWKASPLLKRQTPDMLMANKRVKTFQWL